MIFVLFVASFLVIPNILLNAQWAQNGVTIAGDNGSGSAIYQLNAPCGLFIDDDQTMVVADFNNHRIVEWKIGNTNGQVVAGGHGKGKQSDKWDSPVDVLLDKVTDSFVICDQGNRRVVRWSRSNGTTQAEILIENIDCYGLAMNDQRYLYVSDHKKHEVRRYYTGNKNGTRVAGGHGKGDSLNQLKSPQYIFVDRQQAVYVSDSMNQRVIKWNEGATEGIALAAGKINKHNLDDMTQFLYPNGLFVDTLGTLYVADSWHHQVMRWSIGAAQGAVVLGKNYRGQNADQLNGPVGLSFDRHGVLYVVDFHNQRVQGFSIQ